MNIDLNSLVAIDVETSGPNPYANQLLAVALVPMGESGEAKCWYIKQQTIEWTDVGRKYFGGYKEEWERSALLPQEAASQIAHWLFELGAPELTLIGHNVGFDYAFLRQLSASFPRLSHRTLDTHTLLRLLSWRDNLLPEVCTSSGAMRYFKVEPPPEQRHTALGDALATKLLFIKLLEAYKIRLETNRSSPSVVSRDRAIISQSR